MFWVKMDICTNQKAVISCMGNMGLQEPHPPCHQLTPKTEILGLIKTRVPRHFNREISVIPIRCHFLLKKYPHPPLSACFSETVMAICSLQSLPMLSKKPQQDKKYSKQGPTPPHPYSLQPPNPLSDHLISIPNPQICRRTQQSLQSVY